MSKINWLLLFIIAIFFSDILSNSVFHSNWNLSFSFSKDVFTSERFESFNETISKSISLFIKNLGLRDCILETCEFRFSFDFASSSICNLSLLYFWSSSSRHKRCARCQSRRHHYKHIDKAFGVFWMRNKPIETAINFDSPYLYYKDHTREPLLMVI